MKFKDLHFIPAREEALFACLAAIHECFDALLSMDVATACQLPNLFFVRTGYAARALRKLLNICDSQAEYEGHPHINVEDLKFEEYLDAIIALLGKVHTENNSTIARAFGLVLTQIKTQASTSSKLLSLTKRANESQSVDPKFDPTSDFSIGSKESYEHPCLQLGKVSEPSLLGIPDTASYGSPGVLPEQPVSFSGPLLQQPHSDLNQWQQNAADDTFMSGIDVLQWFEQDFALNAGTFDYDGMSLQPAPAHWQQ